jgi:hypothetical protein
MWHVVGREELYTGFWFGTLRERGYLEDLDVREWIIWSGLHVARSG